MSFCSDPIDDATLNYNVVYRSAIVTQNLVKREFGKQLSLISNLSNRIFIVTADQKF
jgi:hypothetical protein